MSIIYQKCADYFLRLFFPAAARAQPPTCISSAKSGLLRALHTEQTALLFRNDTPPITDQAAFFASVSAEGKMILLTKKKTTMEMPPFSTVVPML